MTAPDRATEPVAWAHGEGVVAHLGDDSLSLLLVSDGGVPAVAHWGAPLGPGPLDLAALERPIPVAALDVEVPVGIVAEAAAGWFGRPGLEGHRSGREFAPRFRLDRSEVAEPGVARFDLSDPIAALTLTLEVTVESGPLVQVRVVVTNVGSTPYELSALRLGFGVADGATELATFGGRWGLELLEHRAHWDRTSVVVENRRGKTSHERLGAVVVGSSGFGNQRGEVWAAHLGWSGNYEFICDAVTDGRRTIAAGELLAAGEITLDPGASYETPPLYLAYSGAGTNGVSRAFHAYQRSRSRTRPEPRPVQLNTWEAVYFDHDGDRLGLLADVAAECGIERFVLDDGWFGGRRSDQAGLGDWWVSDEVWPAGLGALVDRVTKLGMEFGLWVEPEMVNPDSDLYRRHPDWVLGDARYPLVLGRQQLVLDLGRADVRDHLFEAIDDLLGTYDISYLKWDHNRDLVAAATAEEGRAGRSGVHAQTVGTYELIDRLRRAHPRVDIETCASGGGRIDLGILARTDRVWASDSIDALDRLAIQRGFSLLFPPEVMGSHIGSPVAHVTGRQHRLGFRAASALFGWMGVEWNLLDASPEDRDQLQTVIEVHKRHRHLLHHGDVLRVDHPDPTVDVHGVLAADRSEALVAVSRVASGDSLHTAAVLVADLDPDRTYRLSVVDLGEPLGRARRQPAWLGGGLTMTGRQLAAVGVRAPVLDPESALVIHLEAVTS